MLNSATILNGEAVIMWKEAVMEYFMVMSENLPIGTR
jgi:hypothetical protein